MRYAQFIRNEGITLEGREMEEGRGLGDKEERYKEAFLNWMRDAMAHVGLGDKKEIETEEELHRWSFAMTVGYASMPDARVLMYWEGEEFFVEYDGWMVVSGPDVHSVLIGLFNLVKGDGDGSDNVD